MSETTNAPGTIAEVSLEDLVQRDERRQPPPSARDVVFDVDDLSVS